MAMTLHPRRLPSWQTSEPTAPAAPETTSVSPFLMRPMSCRPYLWVVLTSGKGYRKEGTHKVSGHSGHAEGVEEIEGISTFWWPTER